jgi:hypothetical protein
MFLIESVWYFSEEILEGPRFRISKTLKFKKLIKVRISLKFLRFCTENMNIIEKGLIGGSLVGLTGFTVYHFFNLQKRYDVQTCEV